MNKVVVSLMLLASASLLAADERRPFNILLICVDDLKPALGCYGDSLARSPNIDRLAQRGVRFDRAYCNQAVCSPSRNALLTGLRPQTLGIYDLATNFRRSVPDAVTLPQRFKQSGYHTQALGKIFHVGQGNQEDAVSWSVPHWKPEAFSHAVRANREPAPGERKKNVPQNLLAETRRRGTPFESADVSDNTYADGAIADEAIRRLKEASLQRDRPFFLAVGFMKPHLPFCAPQKYWDQFDPSQFKLAERTAPPDGAPLYAPQFGGELRNYRDVPAIGPLPEELQRKLIHGYYAAASYMDAQLGRLIDALDETEFSSNTMIVLWGDHGWHLGDHGMWCKHTNYEQAARIPLIVVLPQAPSRGWSSSALVESVDIYPTLCEWAGLDPPLGLDGRSFAAQLTSPTAPGKESVTHVYPRGSRLGRAIRTDRYRMVEWKVPGAPKETAEIELYDYQVDPLETKNRAKDHPDLVERLRTLLDQQQEARPSINETNATKKKLKG
jgi:iduronate 2-sulfatase